MKVFLNDNDSEFLSFYSVCAKACTITNIKLPESCEPNHFIAIGPNGDGIAIDKPLLEKLMPHFQAWIETGSFEIQEEKDAFDDLAKFRQKLVALREEERKHFSTDFEEFVLDRMIRAIDLVAAKNNKGEAQATLNGYREVYPELFGLEINKKSNKSGKFKVRLIEVINNPDNENGE